jgi:heat shock protein HslJ
MTSLLRTLTFPARVLALAVLVLALPLLAACSSQDGQATPSPVETIGAQPAGGIDLDGTTWTLQSGPFTGDVAAAGITLAFADGQASGTGGVNQYSGTYTATPEGSLQFGAFAVTAMAGDPDAMALEQEYLTALSQAFGYTADDETLTVFGAADQVLVYAAG